MFGTSEYTRSPWEDVLVQLNIIGAIGRLYWHSRGALGGCAGTKEYCRSTRESVAGTEKYYRHTQEALSVQQSTIGALRRLYVYSRVL